MRHVYIFECGMEADSFDYGSYNSFVHHTNFKQSVPVLSPFCLKKIGLGVIHKPRGQIFGYSPPLLFIMVTFAKQGLCNKMVIWLNPGPSALNCPRDS